MVHDVGSLDQPSRDFHSLGGLDVEREVTLATLATEERLAGHAHAVAGDGLDLDHVGTEVADDHGSERAREVLAEVDEPDAFERAHQPAPVTVASASAV